MPPLLSVSTNTLNPNPSAPTLSSLTSFCPVLFYSPVMFYECSIRPKGKPNLLSQWERVHNTDNVTNQRGEWLT